MVVQTPDASEVEGLWLDDLLWKHGSVILPSFPLRTVISRHRRCTSFTRRVRYSGRLRPLPCCRASMTVGTIRGSDRALYLCSIEDNG